MEALLRERLRKGTPEMQRLRFPRCKERVAALVHVNLDASPVLQVREEKPHWTNCCRPKHPPYLLVDLRIVVFENGLDVLGPVI